VRSVAYRRAACSAPYRRPAIASGSDKRLRPIKTHGPGAMLPGHLDRIGLAPMAAPQHQTIDSGPVLAALPSVLGEPGSDFMSDRRPSPRGDSRCRRTAARQSVAPAHSSAGGACPSRYGVPPPFPGTLAGCFLTRPELLRPSIARRRWIIWRWWWIDRRCLQAVQLLSVQLSGDVAARPARLRRITRLRCIAGGRRVSWRRRIVRIVAWRIGVIRVLGI
jgi:hypothetical protein